MKKASHRDVTGLPSFADARGKMDPNELEVVACL